jgi:nucleoside-diphosphate kinase
MEVKTVIERDLGATPPIQVSSCFIAASKVAKEARTAEQAALLAESDALCEEVLAADILVILSPVYMFNIVPTLATYFALIGREGITYKSPEGPDPGLLKGKRAILGLAYGAPVANDLPVQTCKAALGFLGITQVDCIAATSTCDAAASLAGVAAAIGALSFAPPAALTDAERARRERTYIMIKPDGVQRGLVGEIIQRFERKGFQLVAMKVMQPSLELAKVHYQDLSKKGFYMGLCKFLSSSPVVCMIWQGIDAVKSGRTVLGATRPQDSTPGSVRGDYAVDVGRNLCHGSDAVDSAEREIALWFKPEEIVKWKKTVEDWIYE